MPWPDTQILSLGVMFLTGAGLALALDLLGSILGHVDLSEVAPPGQGLGRERGRERPRPRPRPASGPRHPRQRRARRALWDMALWLVVTPLVFGAVLISSRGEMRFYVFVGLGLGVAAYVLLARRFIISVGTASRQAVVEVGGVAVRRVARPVSAVGRRSSLAARGAGRWVRGRGRAVGGWAGVRRQAWGRLIQALLAGFGPKTRE